MLMLVLKIVNKFCYKRVFDYLNCRKNNENDEIIVLSEVILVRLIRLIDLCYNIFNVRLVISKFFVLIGKMFRDYLVMIGIEIL